MPTYEFRCPDGHTFDSFYRKISDAPSELPCPECGKLATRQMSGGAGLLFKGSGFYLTDYGKNAHRKGGDAGADKAKASSESSGGEAKSADATPAETKAADPASKNTKAADAKPASPSTGGASSDKK